MSNFTELSQRLLIGLYCERIFESGAPQEMRWKAVHNCDALRIDFFLVENSVIRIHFVMPSNFMLYTLFRIQYYAISMYGNVIKFGVIIEMMVDLEVRLEASIRCEIPLRFNCTYSPISHTYPITVFLSSISQSCQWNLPFWSAQNIQNRYNGITKFTSILRITNYYHISPTVISYEIPKWLLL